MFATFLVKLEILEIYIHQKYNSRESGRSERSNSVLSRRESFVKNDDVKYFDNQTNMLLVPSPEFQSPKSPKYVRLPAGSKF